MDKYEKQAAAFLKKTGSMIKVELPTETEVKRPLWYKPGDATMQQYRVTLSNNRGSYTFDFYDSIHNTETLKAIDQAMNDPNPHNIAMMRVQRELLDGKSVSRHYLHKHYGKIIDKARPSAYTILACLDQLYADSFEDFCDEFGYDTDSRIAKATYNAMLEQDHMLRRLFTTDELEKLAEIN